MEKKDEKLKEFLKDGFEQTGPTMGFTQNVMRNIAIKEAKKSKPLIGKYSWMVIAVFFLVMICTPFFITQNSTNVKIDFSVIQKELYRINLGAFTILITLLLIVVDNWWRNRTKNYSE